MRNLLSFLIGAVAAELATVLLNAHCRHCGGRVVFALGPFSEQQPGAATRSAPRSLRPPHHPPCGVPDMAFSMTDSQQVTATARFVDKKGNPVAITGSPTWLTDNTDLLTLTPAADGMSCLVVAAGPLGTGTLTVNATGPAGDIAGTAAVTITSGAATQIAIDLGVPSEQP